MSFHLSLFQYDYFNATLEITPRVLLHVNTCNYVPVQVFHAYMTLLRDYL
jgi:hypothetical protein